MYLKASHILPIEGSPLSPGVIRLSKNKIIEVGGPSLLNQKNPDEELLDLGSFVLLPGFVNAHCHLELTSLGPLSPAHFVSWILEMVKRKNAMTKDEMIAGIKQGVQNLLQTGVTTVGDHISFNTTWETILESPLRGKLFAEVLGILPEVCRDIYQALIDIKKDVDKRGSLFEMHITPHSVHGVHPDTLKKVITEQPPPLSSHLAESQTEDDYFRKKGGDLTQLIVERSLVSPHHGKSAFDVLKKMNLDLSKLLVIHGNYLDKSNIKLIKKHQLSIVHCPGSHEYFGHRPFPAKDYLDQRINIALGTDSIVSNTELNFLSELKKFTKTNPTLTPQQILTMATLGGAKALRMENEIGSLIPGKKADIVGFKLNKGENPFETAFQADQADFLMIEGKVIL